MGTNVADERIVLPSYKVIVEDGIVYVNDGKGDRAN